MLAFAIPGFAVFGLGVWVIPSSAGFFSMDSFSQRFLWIWNVGFLRTDWSGGGVFCLVIKAYTVRCVTVSGWTVVGRLCWR